MMKYTGKFCWQKQSDFPCFDSWCWSNWLLRGEVHFHCYDQGLRGNPSATWKWDSPLLVSKAPRAAKYFKNCLKLKLNTNRRDGSLDGCRTGRSRPLECSLEVGTNQLPGTSYTRCHHSLNQPNAAAAYHTLTHSGNREITENLNTFCDINVYKTYRVLTLKLCIRW